MKQIKIIRIFTVLIGYIMNSKNNNALKVNAITPYGVTDKPFAVGAFLIFVS